MTQGDDAPGLLHTMTDPILYTRQAVPLSVTAVLFDMDGVLVDVSGSYRRAIMETVYQFTGRRVTAGMIQRYKNLGGYNDDWRLTAAMVAEAGVAVPFEELVQAFQVRYRGRNWDGFIADEPRLMSTEALARLAERFTMALVTGRPVAEARWTLDRFGWGAYLPTVVGMEDQQGRGKPDPYPIQLALTSLEDRGIQASPEQAVYVGDSIDDMRAARAAGCWAIGVLPPHAETAQHRQVLVEGGAHVVLNHVDALPRVLHRSLR